ncbi:MAG: GyrI-like domain-containing protein [Actinobacteria bacterium]|nr:GyrI-like domain-containing protein [Actinomycetota bacterium]
MAKIDLVRELKELYRPSAKKPAIVDVPEMSFLMVDGSGAPESQGFQEACNALYGMAYTLKFMLKKDGRNDYKVMPLEGLWWMKGTREFDINARDSWQWRVMIALPDEVTSADVTRARAELREKKDPPALSELKFKKFAEGKAVQIMYIGPYSDEGPTIQALHGFAAESGFRLTGRHHEIYMGDPRRSAPEKLKTIIRQPVR